MLRVFAVAYGVLYILIAVFLFVVVHATTVLVLYLVINGTITVGAMILERRRYRPQVHHGSGYWQLTGERFVDPSSGKLMEVRYNKTTGERDYRETSSTDQADG